MKIKCPYCSKEAILITGQDLYPHRTDLYTKYFYQCKKCDAFVGCHPNSKIPLGTLANSELRKMRSKCHELFDAIWKKGRMSRHECYDWLAKNMRLSKEEAHIGKFNMGQCRNLIDLLYKKDMVNL